MSCGCDSLTRCCISDQAERDRRASEAALAELQARLPGPDWKERHGAAGVSKHEKRGSPMVELSLILVRTLWSKNHLQPITTSQYMSILAAYKALFRYFHS